METRVRYRSYPILIKEEISRSQNVYLFPELKVPRTTAQYWVKKQHHTRNPNGAEIDSVYKRKSEYLQKELENERALRRLIETREEFFHSIFIPSI